MRITIGYTELCVSLLWLTTIACMGLAAVAEHHHWLPVGIGLLSAMLACTIIIRAGQRRIIERIHTELDLSRMDADVSQIRGSR